MKIKTMLKAIGYAAGIVLAIGLLFMNLHSATASTDNLTVIEQLQQQIQSLAQRVSVLEARPAYTITVPSDANKVFTGRGISQTAPFKVTTVPWIIEWQASMNVAGGNSFGIAVHDISKSENSNQVGGYGFYVSGNMTGTTYSYLPPGDYYLSIDAGYYMSWTVTVK